MSVYRINKKFRAVPDARAGEMPSEARLAVAEMFGIGLDESYEVALYEDLEVDVRPGDVVFVTGPSGSGKSVLLRCLVAAMRAAEPAARIVDLAEVVAPAGAAVIDGLPGDPSAALGAGFERRLRLVSTAGLADAFLLLRPPEELSDGQRWRLRLAHALACLFEPAAGSKGARRAPAPMRVLVADELASTLDRLCARAVAYRLRRLADREGVTVLAASAHDDLVEDLAPDVLIVKDAGSRVEVRYSNAEPSFAKASEGRREMRPLDHARAALSKVEGRNPEREANSKHKGQTANGKRQ